MSLKSLIEKMDQISALNEATKDTSTGRVHKAEPGGYGRKDDEDSEGKKVEPQVKRGRGRPKKGADSDTGEVKKYDFAKDLQSFMVGNLPGGKAPGKKGQVHKIKDESIEESQDMAEGTELTPGDHALVNHPDKRHIFHGKRVKVGNKNSDGTYHVSTHWNEVGANLPADTLSKLQKQLNLKFPKQGVAEGNDSNGFVEYKPSSLWKHNVLVHFQDIHKQMRGQPEYNKDPGLMRSGAGMKFYRKDGNKYLRVIHVYLDKNRIPVEPKRNQKETWFLISKDGKSFTPMKGMMAEQGVAEGSTTKTKFVIYYKTGKGFDAGTGDAVILASNEKEAKEKFAKKYPHFIVTKLATKEKQGVAEGASSQELENSAGTMTLEQFVDVYGEENEHIWHEVNGKQDVAEAHGNSKIYDKCWTGYKKVPGKKRGEAGSCVKKESVAEATKETSTGRVHKAEPGGYGRKDDEDSEGKKVQPQVKRGRGRPKKNADSDTGEVKKWDTDKLASWIVGNKPKTLPGKASVKHKLKDWMEHVESAMLVESIIDEGNMDEVEMVLHDIINGNSDLYDVMNHPRTPEQRQASELLHRKYETVARDNGLHPDDDFEEIESIMMGELEDDYGTGLSEADQLTIEPASSKVQVIKQGNKVLGQIANPQLANTVKQAIGKGEMQIGGMSMNEDEVMEKAPPGMEDVVLALKKKFPGQEGRAYAVAWDQYNKKHGKKSTNESLDRKEAIMENALVYIIKNHPHEHKMAQDGWGLPENLYQALCDYYHDNGSVPREVWHGDSQALRDWVEECYMKDSSELMENPALLAAIPAALGTAARAIPAVVSGAARTLASPTVGGAMARTAASTALNAISSDGNDEVQEAGVMKPSDRFSDEIPEPEMDVAKMSTFTTPTFIRKQMAAGRKPQFPVTTPVKSDTSELERSLKDSVQTMEEDYMSESKLDEKYMGFNKTVASIKKSGSAENPEAVAAAIGRKKYGKEKFQKAAAAGKKLGETSDDSMMENWENQLNTLLNEGMTITTSTGNEGASDSVSISATDADAQTLMKLLQGAGLTGGKSSMHSVSADQAPSMTVTPVSSDEVMGTLEPQDDGGEEAMGFLKRMIGARASGSSDYSDEEHEETDSEDSGDEESHDHDEHECESCGMSEEVCECGVNEDEVEEGNKFTGNLAKARAAGKKEADLDGDGDMEKVREEEEMCNECGMHESKCGCEHDEEHLNEWANSPDGQSEDEQFATEMEYMTKLLSGGLNNMKRNQTVMPSTEVDVSPDLFRKLAGI